MPRVYNFHFKDAPRDAVNISRPTSFGNPFTHLITDSVKIIKVRDRETAVRCYEQLINCRTSKEIKMLIGDNDFMKIQRLIAQAEWIRRHLEDLRGKDLVCWCSPLPCHGDVLLRLANEE